MSESRLFDFDAVEATPWREGAHLRTEADVARALARGGRGVFTIDELYEACESAGVTGRDDGHCIVHGRTDTRSRRRARNAVSALRRAGRIRSAGAGRWIVDGERDQERWAALSVHGAVLITPDGQLTPIELRLADAGTFLRELAEDGEHPALIVADPPWALNRGGQVDQERDRGERIYAADRHHMVPGYIDVDPRDYPTFVRRVCAAAIEALEPGGYFAVITGPSVAARWQIAAEDEGLVFVNQIVSRRPFPIPMSRQYAHAHHVITVMAHTHRGMFTTPVEQRSVNGNPYPIDWWDDIPKYERPGQVRYDNALPPALVARLIKSYTRGPDTGHDAWADLVADPFNGSGTTAICAAKLRRRCVAADINPHSLSFTMARSIAEAATA